jgi:hypothetical protein
MLFYQWAVVSEVWSHLHLQLPWVSHNASSAHNGLLLFFLFRDSIDLAWTGIYLKISLPIGCGYPLQASSSYNEHPWSPFHLFSRLIHVPLHWSEPLCIVSSQRFSSVIRPSPILYWSAFFCLNSSPWLDPEWFLPSPHTRPSLIPLSWSWAVLFSLRAQIPVPFLFLLLGLIQCTYSVVILISVHYFPVHFLIWSISPHSNNCY